MAHLFRPDRYQMQVSQWVVSLLCHQIFQKLSGSTTERAGRLIKFLDIKEHQ